jgi:hypothetical protein
VNNEPSNTPAEEKPKPDIYDPFAPENLKLPQDVLDQAVADPLLTVIEVKKPGKQQFVRIHPSEEYRHVAALITDELDGGTRYLIDTAFLPRLQKLDIPYDLEQLFLYVTRQGELGFWPIKLRKNNKKNTWLESATGAADKGMTTWVCIVSKSRENRYQAYEAKGEFLDPDWRKLTQGKTVYELLRIAFEDRLISDESHPLIQRLLGYV